MREDGIALLVAVDSAIAVGSGIPAAVASSSQLRNRSRGSAVATF
jgi:hypothetical protein